MATRNGQRLGLSGADSITGRFFPTVIQADTTNELKQIINGSTSTFWSPNVAGDTIDVSGTQVDGFATTAAGDGFQIFLK